MNWTSFRIHFKDSGLIQGMAVSMLFYSYVLRSKGCKDQYRSYSLLSLHPQIVALSHGPHVGPIVT